METSVFVCEFCGSSHKTSTSLTYHKRNAKKCLRIQGELLPEEEIVCNLVSCAKCNVKFSSRVIKLHTITCKGTHDIATDISSAEIAELKLQITELNLKLKTKDADIANLQKHNVRLGYKVKRVMNKNSELNSIISDQRAKIRGWKKKPAQKRAYHKYLELIPQTFDMSNISKTRKALEISTYEDWHTLKRFGIFVAKNILEQNGVATYPRIAAEALLHISIQAE